MRYHATCVQIWIRFSEENDLKRAEPWCNGTNALSNSIVANLLAVSYGLVILFISRISFIFEKWFHDFERQITTSKVQSIKKIKSAADNRHLSASILFSCRCDETGSGSFQPPPSAKSTILEQKLTMNSP
jgi:hypothetical protein